MRRSTIWECHPLISWRASVPSRHIRSILYCLLDVVQILSDVAMSSEVAAPSRNEFNIVCGTLFCKYIVCKITRPRYRSPSTLLDSFVADAGTSVMRPYCDNWCWRRFATSNHFKITTPSTQAISIRPLSKRQHSRDVNFFSVPISLSTPV